MKPALAWPTCLVIELRQYTLHPGQRDVLIDLFEREFVETQEAVGMHVLGQFRDLDDPDRFVWLRGFPDMSARADGLAAFYGGPVWQAHRDAANATMVDSDNVLLLRPATGGSGFALTDDARAGIGSRPLHAGLVVATICPLAAQVVPDVVTFFERTVQPALAAAGAPVAACLVTENQPNNFPRLPVREGESVVVGLAPRDIALPTRLVTQLAGPPRLLRLQPTRRSPLT